jgi:hypothetical protein
MAQTQQYAIDFGGYTLGGATGRPIEAFAQHRIGAAVSSVDFTFVVSHPDKATFVGLCEAAEAAFRKPRQSLLVTNGGLTILTLSHTGNTGFDSDPHIVKQGQFGDSANSRFYTVEITFGMPADNLGTGGRRNSDVALTYDEARMAVLTISGTYTATPGSSASDNYDAGIGPYCTARLAEYGITYANLKPETVVRNETDKVLQFTRVYHQIIYSEAGAALDDPEIQTQALVISRIDEAPGDSPEESVTRLATAVCTYDAVLNALLTTDVRGKWEEIKDWVGAQASSILDGAFAVVKREVKFFPDTNRLSAVLTLEGSTTGSVIAMKVTTTDKVLDNPNLKPVLNGDRWARMYYPGFPDLTRTRVETKSVVIGGDGTTVESGNPPDFSDPDTDPVASGLSYMRLGPSGGRWARLSKDGTEEIRQKGQSLGGNLVISDRTTTTTWQYFHEFEAVGIGGDADPDNPQVG